MPGLGELMGYTTRFSGKFAFSRQLTLDEKNVLDGISQGDGELHEGAIKDGSPDGYCQWETSKDGRSLQWDGSEKFYDYEEWLRFLVEKRLKPWGVDVTGRVTWQGEDIDDRGILTVRDGVVMATKIEPNGTKVTCPECDHEFQVGDDED